MPLDSSMRAPLKLMLMLAMLAGMLVPKSGRSADPGMIDQAFWSNVAPIGSTVDELGCRTCGELCCDGHAPGLGTAGLGTAGLGTAGLGTAGLGTRDPACCEGTWGPRADCVPGGVCHNASTLAWLDQVAVGYDNGFVIASRNELNLNAERYPYRLKINGWGQLRHTVSEVADPNTDLNQFQLKRGRLIFSGNAFNPNLQFFIQLDGRSTSGDSIRLLDYYLSYDFGKVLFDLQPESIGFRTGMYKMPFTLARWVSGKEFEFTDRSMSSTFFDVNRSFAWGLYGQRRRGLVPLSWEVAIFNGLVTGGAETGASGTLDDNFAYSGRLMMYPIGVWGASHLADMEHHDRLAMRLGLGFANSKVERFGSTEFQVVRVVDTGDTLASLLPNSVDGYGVDLYSVDASFKYRGWSSTIETYFRQIDSFQGAELPNLSDRGFWFQLGYMIVPKKLELLARWSRIWGDSGTLGVEDQSSEEIAGGLAWYIRDHHSKVVFDITNVNGASIKSAALDINPGDDGWIYRSQIQFSF